MQKELLSILELNRDAVLLIEDGKITYMNSAAQELFPHQTLPRSAVGLVPDYILFDESEKFVSSALLDRKQYTVSAQRQGTALILSLFPAAAAFSSGLLSDGLMAQMLSALFNLELSAKNISDLLPETASSELRSTLSVLQHSYYSLNRQLTNLNTAKLLQENSFYCSFTATNLVELVCDLVCSVAAFTGDNHAGITFSTLSDTIFAEVDAPSISRLLLNLLSNSLKYTPKDGSIRVKLSKSGEHAVLSVSDTGRGIPAEVLKNIFTRYEQRLSGADLSGEISGGLGLGIARSIAQKHGGALIIESREGEGTNVRAMLPLKQSDIVKLREPDLSALQSMELILTELADILDAKFYTPEYLE